MKSQDDKECIYWIDDFCNKHDRMPTPKEIWEAARAAKPAIQAHGETENLYAYIVPPCKDHPDAPHGFDRTASHSLGQYVCTCENWEP